MSPISEFFRKIELSLIGSKVEINGQLAGHCRKAEISHDTVYITGACNELRAAFLRLGQDAQQSSGNGETWAKITTGASVTMFRGVQVPFISEFEYQAGNLAFIFSEIRFGDSK